MVSNNVFLLLGGVLAACLVASDGFALQSEKCKINEEEMGKHMPEILECCSHALDKTCEAKTLLEDMTNMSDEQEDKMCKCAAEKKGILTPDGKFHVEKAMEAFKGFVLAADTKAELESKIDECAKEHDHDGDATRKCVRKAAEEICKS